MWISLYQRQFSANITSMEKAAKLKGLSNSSKSKFVCERHWKLKWANLGTHLCEAEWRFFLLATLLELDSAASCSSAFCSSSNLASYRKNRNNQEWACGVRYMVLKFNNILITESWMTPHQAAVWAPCIVLLQDQNHPSEAPVISIRATLQTSWIGHLVWTGSS